MKISTGMSEFHIIKQCQSSIYIYVYTTSEKPVNDQSYGVLDGYGITILYKQNNYKRLKWFVNFKTTPSTQNKVIKN
jgi:hypothetical protein